ncbi:DUF1015 family protein [Pedobacter sp. L105]|uniref:DUF1015 family protein n=1 Tax=Pedobacter sp. L105 TaxID=1641871 RepID=UPI00131D8FF1|nr:DUF1015 family protein [Pedobacter sp. L105]
MANIKAFRALRAGLTEKGSLIKDLKIILEPSSNYSESLQPYLSSFRRLMLNKSLYIENEPAIYIYENCGRNGKQRGIWALTNVNDHTINDIILHEQTITEQEEKIKTYREQIGLEGEPILLTYLPRVELNILIEKIIQSTPPEYYFHEGVLHQLWKVTSTAVIEELKREFSNLKNLYVADGHHRLAAALSLQHEEEQWISTLYVATDQLNIREFNRLILPDTHINREALLELINQYFLVYAIPGNTPFRPARHHQMGMCLCGKWYQLDLMEDKHPEIDATILQEYILEPFFKIEDPRDDSRLKNLDPLDGWAKLIVETKENLSSIAFTLFPMTADQLISCANEQKTLPPKSTWIEPKIPYGLLLHWSKQPDLKEIVS